MRMSCRGCRGKRRFPARSSTSVTLAGEPAFDGISGGSRAADQSTGLFGGVLAYGRHGLIALGTHEPSAPAHDLPSGRLRAFQISSHGRSLRPKRSQACRSIAGFAAHAERSRRPGRLRRRVTLNQAPRFGPTPCGCRSYRHRPPAELRLLRCPVEKGADAKALRADGLTQRRLGRSVVETSRRSGGRPFERGRGRDVGRQNDDAGASRAS